MAITVTQERLFRVKCRGTGADLIHGVFSCAFSGNYSTGGDTADLSPFFKELISCEVEPLYNATNTPVGFMYVVDDTNFAVTSSSAAQVSILLLYPCASHTHTIYAHGHDLAFLNAGGGGNAVTLSAAPRLESAGGAATDTASIQDTTAVMQASTAAQGTEVPNATAYPTNLACRLIAEGY